MPKPTRKQSDLIAKLCQEIGCRTPNVSDRKRASAVITDLIETRRHMQLAAKNAERAEKLADVIAVPPGRYPVIGTIRSTGRYGDFNQLKAVLEDEDGNRYFVAIPQAAQEHLYVTNLVGAVLEVKATWTPKDDDPHFAYGHKPVGAFVGVELGSRCAQEFKDLIVNA